MKCPNCKTRMVFAGFGHFVCPECDDVELVPDDVRRESQSGRDNPRDNPTDNRRDKADEIEMR